MKLISLKQFEKKSRGSLMRFINGYLKTQSKKQIAIFAYTLAKSKLPRLKTIKQKALPWHTRRMVPKRKTKRKKMTKAEKNKFLARINKGRIKAGLKPIRAKK